MMPKLLLKYAKEDRLRFLSHLEVAKVLERAFRRARLPLTISGGFHPKPKLSYGPALALGTSSVSEYVVVSLDTEVPIESAREKVAEMLPIGIRLMDAGYLAEGSPSLGRAVAAASYTLRISTDRSLGEEETQAAIAWLFGEQELVVERENKRKVVERNDVVLDASGRATPDGVEFKFLLSVGNSGGISPTNLARLLLESIAPPVAATGIEIQRTGLFSIVDDRQIDLFEYYGGPHEASN